MSKPPAQLQREINEVLAKPLGSERIKKLDPEMAATWIAGVNPLTDVQRRVLTIACRDGGYVAAGTGEHRGHVERVPAAAVLALIRRGYLEHTYGSEGGVAGRLSAKSLAILSRALGEL